MRLPNGASQVVAARRRGLMPAEMLIVSMIGRTGEANHTVHANPGGEYDWRWVRGLKICVYVNGSTHWREQLTAIAKHHPQWLGLYNVDQFSGATAFYLPRAEDIDKPRSQWRYVLDFLPWTTVQNETFAWSD